MKKDKYNIAVAGATGAVGNEIIKILEERSFPVGNIRLLASSRSAGSSMEFQNRDRTVELLSEDSFQGGVRSYRIWH